MKIKLSYDSMFKAKRNTETKEAMKYVRPFQLANLVKWVPDLPEQLQKHFEVEIPTL